MEQNLRIIVFGDQTSDYQTNLGQLLHVKGNPILSSFFEQSYIALRHAIAQQSRSVQESIPGFSSVTELLARYTESCSANSAIDSALICISQIACFIGYQKDALEGYPTPSNTRIVGTCTGLLAAAAVSSSRNLVELLPAAVEVVRIAFRIGVCVAEVRDQIEQRSSIATSWSVITSGIQEREASLALFEFNESKHIPQASRAYISGVSQNALTFSGPHLVLDGFFQSESFKNYKPLRLPIYGPYHAAHLYSADALQALLQSSSVDILDTQVYGVPLLSTGVKGCFSASSLRQLLEGVLEDILIRPLHWDIILKGVLDAVRKSGNPRCTVLQMGPSNAGQSLISNLKQNEKLEIVVDDRFLRKTKDFQSSQPSGRLADSKIAICGLAGRFPDAANHALFWDLLEKGLDLHREVPKDRFDPRTHVDPSGKRRNTSHTPFGCFIKDPGLFDPRFFNMSPREATQTDPMQRLALVTAYEALEMSGYVPNRTPSSKLDRIGTFYGQTSDDWREINAAQEVDTYFITGGVRAFGPGRINYHFNFSGPSFNIDTACSSSLAAIQIACTSLWAGDCDTAVAGGMNVLTNPDIFSGLSRGQFLSKKGPCQTFDNEADGYCRADGVGTVILKRLEDAEADKDPILAVILGSATNHSAEAVSITHPHAGAQEFLYSKVLVSAGIDPHDVSYVEMHGTGTQAGDATEMQSVTNVFAPQHRRRRLDQKLHLGTVKANAGHSEAASGITSLAKVLMMMEKSVIPPHCGIKGTINRTFPKDLEKRNVHIAFEPTPWTRPEGQKRRLFLNNFSAAGGNTALLLEDAPPTSRNKSQDPRSTHLVALSARSAYSLRQNIENLIAFLDENPTVELPNLSYTTTARRTHYNHRLMVSSPDMAKIKGTLATCMGEDIAQIPSSKPKVAFAFTGQGSHYAAMGKQLFDHSSQFRDDIRLFDTIGRNQGFPSIQPLIDGTVTDIQTLGPLVVQLGAVCVQMALTRLWVLWGITPSVVVGHSLGEYAALNAAGVLSVSDTIYLVGQRARFLEDKCQAGSHVMLAVKSSVDSIGQVLDGKIFEVACINAPEETVVSGTNINIDILAKDLEERGLKSTKLPVPFAFHSSQVEPVLDGFEAAAEGVTFRTPSVPVISPLLREIIIDDGTFGPAYLRRHCRETVNFAGSIEAAAEHVTDDSIWVEIGSHPICSGMLKATLGPHVKTVPSLRRNDDDWKVIADGLCALYHAGLDIDWNEYHRDFASSHQFLRLPTYCWDNKIYWIDYTRNWCLTKGDSAAAAGIPESKLSSTTVHRIVEENIDETTATLVTESDLAEPDMNAAIMGHEVNGFGLCPPSLYADMAYTIAEYLFKQLKPDVDHIDMNVCNMRVESPLIANGTGQQFLRVAANASIITNQVDFTYFSVTPEGERVNDHAKCSVKYEDAESWATDWERNAYMVHARVDKLIDGVHERKNNVITRGMAYKLFGGLIHYDQKYRGMEEVILDSAELEATSSVAFQATEKDGNFFCSPYWIDSVAHLSGFIMLANETADPSSQVYVSHGWESCRILRPFSADKKYRAYVKMQPAGPKTVVGNVYVFEMDTIVAIVGGLKFHCLPRQLMDSTLSKASGRSSSTMPEKSVTPNPKKSSTKSTQKPKTTPRGPKTKKQAAPYTTARAMDIVANEVGVSASELPDGTKFADVGVDSLLSLTISGKFREGLGLEVPSSLFVDCPTVKDLKQFLSQHDSCGRGPDESPEDTSSEDSPSGVTSPNLETESQSSVPDDEDDTVVKASDQEKVTTIQSTIAGEMGVPVEEVGRTTNLADLGVDSLMSLSVLGKVRETTGEELPSDFLTENATFDAIEKSLDCGSERSVSSRPRKEGSATEIESERKQESRPGKEHNGKHSKIGKVPETKPSSLPEGKFNNNDSVGGNQFEHDKNYNKTRPPPATSILMQGNPKIARKKLFFFPDGSGSATSYKTIPKVDADVAIYALNCPFMKAPEEYTCGIQGVSALYLEEVRRRQPNGPYCFGGWSAGGVAAYEVAFQALMAGETVERLILLDAPCPVGLEPLPSSLHDFFDSIGLLGTEGGHPKGTPGWLLPHFESSIRNLAMYKPKAMDPQQSPSTFLIWAQDGVCKYLTDPRPDSHDEDPESMKWLLEDRQDLRFNGWDNILGAENIRATESVAHVNHFTMMREPHTNELAGFIQRALS